MEMFRCKNIRWGMYAIPIMFVLIMYFVIHRYILVKEYIGTSFGRRTFHGEMRDKSTGTEYVNSFMGEITDKSKKRDKSILNSSVKETDVFIIEEHHEVLPVWFGAVSSGKIPTKGNTLIHIDGHSDMGIPRYSKDYPAWRFPRTKDELTEMMQSNDVFIMEAVMTGLMNRVIWVWPKWDSPDEHLMSEYKVIMEVGYAFVKKRHFPFNKMKVFCSCEYADHDVKEDKNCLYLDTNEESKEKELDQDLCIVKRKLVYEEIQEDKFLERLKSQTVLSPGEHMMLDIDEDYHGCTYASEPLFDAGFTETSVKDLDILVSSLVCPETSDQEMKADKLLIEIIDRIKSMPYICENKSTGTRNCQKVKEIHLKNKEILSYLARPTGPYSCGRNNTKIEALSLSFLEALSNLNQKQLNALQYVGFCFTTTPKTSDGFEREFRICYGANTPNDSMVFQHSPDLNEIQRRSQTLHKMLMSLQDHQPRIITVCRSVRDGYTPREHFHTIERNILSSANTAFNKVNFNYDIDLLGGKFGWRNNGT